MANPAAPFLFIKNKNNAMRKKLLLVFLFFSIQQAFCQNTPPSEIEENIIFKDTAENFVFDSIVNNFNELTNSKLIKHFKYIGEDPVVVLGKKSGDPYFICDYPRDPI